MELGIMPKTLRFMVDPLYHLDYCHPNFSPQYENMDRKQDYVSAFHEDRWKNILTYWATKAGATEQREHDFKFHND